MLSAWEQAAGEAGTCWGRFRPGTELSTVLKEKMAITRCMASDGRQQVAGQWWLRMEHSRQSGENEGLVSFMQSFLSAPLLYCRGHFT